MNYDMDILYYDNPKELLHSNFIDYLLRIVIDLIIRFRRFRFFIFVTFFVCFIFVPVWMTLDLIGNLLDYITYHYSVTFILWGLSQEEKNKVV